MRSWSWELEKVLGLSKLQKYIWNILRVFLGLKQLHDFKTELFVFVCTNCITHPHSVQSDSYGIDFHYCD